MEIYFLRHATAAPHGAYVNDADRPLVDEGRDEMKKAGRGMRELGLEFDAVVSSPYVRARETAEIAVRETGFKGPLKFSDALKPGGSLGSLKKLLAEFPPDSRLLLVGHEPSMSGFIGGLAGSPAARVDMKKAGLGRVDLDEAGEGTLKFLMGPKLLKKLA